jgi:hypothetical protein
MLKRLVVSAIVVALLFLAGCTYSKSQLKSDPENISGKVEADRNYQEVYRNINKMAKECLEGKRTLGTPTISAELYHDIKEGNIEQRAVGEGAFILLTLIEIKALDDKRTEVRLYVNNNRFYTGGLGTLPEMHDIERWINGDVKCWVDEAK